MKMMQHELIGTKIGEIRIMYQTSTREEDVVLEELNKALDAIRKAGIQVEKYSDEDETRFCGLEEL